MARYAKPLPDGYWATCIDALSAAIQREGWTVELYGDLGANYYGSCNYDTKTLTLDCPQARKAFLTLCHEDGHRKAASYWGAKDEDHFERLCPRRAFREHQALVFGWHTVQHYDPEGRITLPAWMREHGLSLTWRGV